MARDESDRENLMAEATAYHRRAEFQCPKISGPVFVGLRSDGSLSVYVDQDPVYHFNADGKLKRAFVDRRILRTQGNTLARLQRSRKESRTELLRTDLTDKELHAFRATASEHLQRVAVGIREEDVASLTIIPADDANLTPDVATRIASILKEGLPLAPAFRGRR